jgi:type III pantothenate kinase
LTTEKRQFRSGLSQIAKPQPDFMFLAIDVGNTNITLGVYKGEILSAQWRLATGHEKTPDEYGALILGFFRRANLSAPDVHAIAMASVVPPLTGTLVESCRQFLCQEPLVVDRTCHTGIKISCDDPGQVGADRIVDAAAAYKLYGGPACVIDFGTATTFDAVSPDGEYLGGAIAPGIGIASQALFEHTAKLPKVDLRWPPAAIGKNTMHSVQSGLMFGYVGLVEGIVGRFKKELGEDLKVIATGGLSDIIAGQTKVISVVAPSLTLDGLRIIHALNSC